MSVIFPIFNNADYLERCVESVINQTLQDIELILINDGSTDKRTPAICDKFARMDSRVRVIHKENVGSAAGRNQGIELANGKYVAFVESDDYVVPTMYAQLYHLAAWTDADIVKCNFFQCFGEITRETNYFSQLGKTGVEFTATERPRIFGYHASI